MNDNDTKISRFPLHNSRTFFIIKDPHANGSGEGGSRNGTKSVSFKPLKENGLEKKLHDGNLSLSFLTMYFIKIIIFAQLMEGTVH
jgi:hypothetical protein